MDPGIEISLDELKRWNKSIVNEIRSEKLLAGYFDLNTNIRWDSDPIAIQNLAGLCTLIACGVVSSDQVWRDMDNNNHNLSVTELITLAASIALYTKLCYVNSWAHKANIENINDVNDLKLYDVTVNWP